MVCGHNGENGARTYRDKPMQDGNASAGSNIITGKKIKMINQTGNIYNTSLRRGKITQNGISHTNVLGKKTKINSSQSSFEVTGQKVKMTNKNSQMDVTGQKTKLKAARGSFISSDSLVIKGVVTGGIMGNKVYKKPKLYLPEGDYSVSSGKTREKRIRGIKRFRKNNQVGGKDNIPQKAQNPKRPIKLNSKDKKEIEDKALERALKEQKPGKNGKYGKSAFEYEVDKEYKKLLDSRKKKGPLKEEEEEKLKEKARKTVMKRLGIEKHYNKFLSEETNKKIEEKVEKDKIEQEALELALRKKGISMADFEKKYAKRIEMVKTKQKEGTEVPESVLEAERMKLYKDLGIDSDIQEKRKEVEKRRRRERKFVTKKQMELFGYADADFEFSEEERRRIDSIGLSQEQQDRINKKQLSDKEKVNAVSLSDEELKEIDEMKITDEERKKLKERLLHKKAMKNVRYTTQFKNKVKLAMEELENQDLSYEEREMEAEKKVLEESGLLGDYNKAISKAKIDKKTLDKETASELAKMKKQERAVKLEEKRNNLAATLTAENQDLENQMLEANRDDERERIILEHYQKSEEERKRKRAERLNLNLGENGRGVLQNAPVAEENIDSTRYSANIGTTGELEKRAKRIESELNSTHSAINRLERLYENYLKNLSTSQPVSSTAVNQNINLGVYNTTLNAENKHFKLSKPEQSSRINDLIAVSSDNRNIGMTFEQRRNLVEAANLLKNEGEAREAEGLKKFLSAAYSINPKIKPEEAVQVARNSKEIYDSQIAQERLDVTREVRSRRNISEENMGIIDDMLLQQEVQTRFENMAREMYGDQFPETERAVDSLKNQIRSELGDIFQVENVDNLRNSPVLSKAFSDSELQEISKRLVQNDNRAGLEANNAFFQYNKESDKKFMNENPNINPEKAQEARQYANILQATVQASQKHNLQGTKVSEDQIKKLIEEIYSNDRSGNATPTKAEGTTITRKKVSAETRKQPVPNPEDKKGTQTGTTPQSNRSNITGHKKGQRGHISSTSATNSSNNRIGNNSKSTPPTGFKK